MKVKTKFVFAVLSAVFLLFISNVTQAQEMDYSSDDEVSTSPDEYVGVTPASVEEQDESDLKTESNSENNEYESPDDYEVAE